MKILVTGAKGFVGRNLCSQLKNIRDGKAKWYNLPEPIEAIYEYDIDSTPEQLDEWCKECDFVFNLAGVNRPKDPEEFMKGNFGFATTLLNTLKKYKNNCPVMISSSIQATLAGRFGTSEYGKSKKAGEELMFEYGKETGAKVLVYRFPNLFGKWCRPNYNSAIATFCNNIATDLPIQVNDRSVEMELLYIDDLVDEMIAALKGEAHYCEYAGLTPIPFPKGQGGSYADKFGVHTADPTLYDVLKQHAENMRKNPTEAEEVLWKALKGKGLDHKFRRQHIIGDYIVDFFCNELNLTIEIDGGYHSTPEQRDADDLRTAELMKMGYTELRFKNEEVLFDLENVLSQIKSVCELKSSHSGEDLGGAYCFVPITHKTTLGEIVDIIHECANAAANKDGINMSALPQGSLRYKLMTTYLSYLPKENAIYDHKMNVDARGSFTELLHTLTHGQVSINISKPGITKGEHWHHSKFEYFTVVSGHGLIQLRPENPDFLSQKDKETNSQKEGSSTLSPLDSSTDGIIEYEVSGDKIQSVIMLPGYTHNIINLSDTEDLVTVMYCNEIFNPQRPDTYFDKVVKE